MKSGAKSIDVTEATSLQWSWTHRGQARYLGPDGDQVLLQEPLLVQDLVCVGRLLLVRLHLLVGQIQDALQLVLKRRGAEERSTAESGRDVL